jgi:hypothetical protein
LRKIAACPSCGWWKETERPLKAANDHNKICEVQRPGWRPEIVRGGEISKANIQWYPGREKIWTVEEEEE